jgi:O-Antigen ligase
MNVGSRLGTGAIVLLPGALTVYLSFNAGGFFPDTTAFAAILLAGALIARISLAATPFAGFSRPFAVAAGALALFAGWTLASAAWSDAPGRALVEFDRALLYLLAIVLFGSLPRSTDRARTMLWGLAAGIVVVSAAGLVTRLLPDVWPISETIADNRLSYPLTYWNSLGLLSAIGAVLCFHLTSNTSEPRAARVLGAAAIPLLATTVLFTFSRGAIAAGAVGLVAYVAIARPRALVSALIAAGPPAAVALVAAYHADLLATLDPTSTRAVAQGHDLALVVALCIAAAAALRGLLLLLDARLLPRDPRRRSLARPAVVVPVAAMLLLAIALDLPGAVGRQYDQFVQTGNVGNSADLRSRLTDPANNGRLDEWDVALDGFAKAPAIGQGAGTYQVQWAEHRPIVLSVRDGHSLYLEVLNELGLVGMALLLIAVLSILGALAVRARGADRTLYAALLAGGLVWGLHAGIDWDWEMPAVTLWLVAAGGAALAATAGGSRLVRPPHPVVRCAAAVACFVLAVVPALVMVSEARLDSSVTAFERGDCAGSVRAADSARAALAQRPQPYEMIGYCRLQQGRIAEGIAELERAAERDPRNWEYRYELAVARGAAGLDPRPDAHLAKALNPLDSEVNDAVRRFRTSDRVTWKRQARSLLRGASPFYLSDR